MSRQTPEAPRLVILTTVPVTAYAFLRGQLGALRAAGYDVMLITSPDPALAAFAAAEGVQVQPIPMAREISPLADLRALIALIRTFRSLRPEVVNAGTPKAGLLGMVAAWLTRTPVRIYHMRGLRMETATGAKRTLLAWMERVAAACSQIVVCNSESLRCRFIDLGLAPAHKTVVLGQGTSNGLDTARFAATPVTQEAALALRATLGIPAESPVIGFVGRMTRDKGVEELVAAFARLQQVQPDVHLLLVGDVEAGDPLPAATLAHIAANPAIHTTGFQHEPAPFYHAMDLLAFPSQREGFPNVPLEAAAAGLPVVGYRVTGTLDAVVDGATGLLVERGDVAALGNALRLLVGEPTLRRRLGEQGRARVISTFDRATVWQHWVAFYAARGAARPPGLYRSNGKRLFDLLVAVPALLLLSPLIAALALLVRVRLGAPVFFRQQRPGLHGRPFRMVKFRTMTDARDAQGNLLPDADRLTPFGRFLRSSSLDELPELWNVVRGDMSLVGPRPLLMQYLPLYTPEQARRHALRPGITGWAQINGRNAISWEQKFAYDVWYVDHCSLALDLRILWGTLAKIVRREGISQAGEATMPVFTGAARDPVAPPEE